MADDGLGLAEALLGLPAFRVLDVTETAVEVIVTIESTADFTGSSRCGVRAESQDRMPVHLRDLPCFGRPARLVWIKRRWRCPDSDRSARTWTEVCEDIDAQVVLTRRAGMEACRQVGAHARPVAQVAREFGIPFEGVGGTTSTLSSLVRSYRVSPAPPRHGWVATLESLWLNAVVSLQADPGVEDGV